MLMKKTYLKGKAVPGLITKSCHTTSVQLGATLLGPIEVLVGLMSCSLLSELSGLRRLLQK